MKSVNKSHKQTVVTIVAITLVALLALLVLEKAKVTNLIQDPFYQPAQQGPSPEQQKTAADTAAKEKEQSISAARQQDNAEPAPVPTNTNTITLIATQSNTSVTVYNELKGQGYSSGTCKLTVKNADKTTSQTAEIIYQPEYSMCAGFTVPVSTIGAGNWDITLEVTPFNGQSLVKTTSVKVQ